MYSKENSNRRVEVCEESGLVSQACTSQPWSLPLLHGDVAGAQASTAARGCAPVASAAGVWTAVRGGAGSTCGPTRLPRALSCCAHNFFSVGCRMGTGTREGWGAPGPSVAACRRVSPLSASEPGSLIFSPLDVL